MVTTKVEKKPRAPRAPQPEKQILFLIELHTAEGVPVQFLLVDDNTIEWVDYGIKTRSPFPKKLYEAWRVEQGGQWNSVLDERYHKLRNGDIALRAQNIGEGGALFAFTDPKKYEEWVRGNRSIYKVKEGYHGVSA